MCCIKSLLELLFKFFQSFIKHVMFSLSFCASVSVGPTGLPLSASENKVSPLIGFSKYAVFSPSVLYDSFWHIHPVTCSYISDLIPIDLPDQVTSDSPLLLQHYILSFLVLITIVNVDLFYYNY